MRERSRGGVASCIEADIEAVPWAGDPVVDVIALDTDSPVAEGKRGRRDCHCYAEATTLLGPPLSDLEMMALAGPVDYLPTPVA